MYVWAYYFINEYYLFTFFKWLIVFLKFCKSIKQVCLSEIILTDLPVSQKGTYKTFCLFRHFNISGEVKRSFVIHNFTISSHKRICIKRCVTCKRNFFNWDVKTVVWVVVWQTLRIILLKMEVLMGMCVLTNKHFIKEDTHRPPITLSAITALSTLGLQNFWWDVIWCANSCIWVHKTILWTDNSNQS